VKPSEARFDSFQIAQHPNGFFRNRFKLKHSLCVSTHTLKNVYKSLDHNALFYHKGFQDVFISALGELITHREKLSAAKKFGILKQRFSHENTAKTAKQTFQLGKQDY